MQPMRMLETSVYADDLKIAKGFYRDIIGLELIREEPGRHVFFRCGPGVFLIFNAKATEKDSCPDDAIDVPTHGARGPGHACFAITAEKVDAWRDHLQDHGIEIEQEINWPNGAHSLYFRDPAGNSMELATPSLWGIEG